MFALTSAWPVVQVNIEALQASHAKEVAELAGQVAAEKAEREAATARLRKEQEAERERVKRALAELKKKLDRCARSFCISAVLSAMQAQMAKNFSSCFIQRGGTMHQLPISKIFFSKLCQGLLDGISAEVMSGVALH